MRPLLFCIQCIGGNYYSFLFKITKAPITPGTQPQQVSNNTINTEPQPLSITAKGGKNNANITRKQDIMLYFSQTVSLLDRSLRSLRDRSFHSLRDRFTSLTEGSMTLLTEGSMTSLTEGSMSLTARRAVSQRSGLSTQWSLSDVVAVQLILIALEYG